MPRKSERTRLKIVESANRLFYRQGYHRTSFSDVVSATGVPRGNIYYYFKTKDEILEATIEFRIARIKGMLQSWSETIKSPELRLERFLEILPSTAESLTRYGCPMGSLNTELGKDDQQLQSLAREMFLLFEGWLSDQFSELGYSGRAQELAQRLIVQGQGISVMTHVYGSDQLLRRETLRLRHWIQRLASGQEDIA